MKDQTVNAHNYIYLGVLKRLEHRIRRIRSVIVIVQKGSWRLLHDNPPSHRTTLVTDFMAKNRILTANHSSYTPDLHRASSNFSEKCICL